MEAPVTIERVKPRLLAAVRRTAAPGEIPRVFKPALDLVWAFLGRNKGLRTDGHNVFLYHHVGRPEVGMPVDFGVEVTRRFEPEGEVRSVETPEGKAAVLVHRGDYRGLPQAHAALHAWCAANGRRIGAHSLEIYGDWTSDPRAGDDDPVPAALIGDALQRRGGCRVPGDGGGFGSAC